MAEAETLCNRVAIIDYGELLSVGTVEALKQSIHRERVIRVAGIIPKKAATAVEALPGVQHASLTAVDGIGQLTVVTENGHNALPGIITLLMDEGAVIQKLAPEEITLEDVFIAKTGRTLAEDTRAA
jgi:ABC-2 type transport system ATP-binding protein